MPALASRRWALSASVCCVVMSIASSASNLFAAVKPHALFSDNTVLQQGMKLPVWGTTDSNDKITVSVAGQEVAAEPKDGRWRAELAPLAASSTPVEMTIRQGDQTVAIKNVLIGEVWICGGQSNMEWAMQNSDHAAEAISAATNDQIRLITVPRGGAKQPETDINAKWVVCSPETVKGFSAVGYFFGRDLQRDRKAPVGLINSNVGGTPAERWTSQAVLDADPDLKSMKSGDLYNHMIASLGPYANRGAIWYQGEANADRAKQYRKLLPATIKSWRESFETPDAAFLIVQLAPYMPISKEPQESHWAQLRDAQLWVSQNVPKCGLAVITDVGDERDIHPRKKEPVGSRLALAARAIEYGEKIEYSGPLFDQLSIRGSDAVVSFKHIGGGLVAKGDTLTGFTIAGEDQKFHNAKARIEGDTVVVSSDEVPKPVAVRFGWANYPVVNLWNKADLPASPFRSDDFPTGGK